MTIDKHTSENEITEDTNLFEHIYAEAIEPDSVNSEYQIMEELENIEDRYRIIREIARGGIKKIYLVEDRATGRELAMAVRQHYTEESDSEVFLREARITASLQHPNIIPIYDIGTDSNNQAFFTMKYVEGQSLQHILPKRRRSGSCLSLSERIGIFYKICEAVAYAHNQGVLHLDLKPANIQVSGYGEVVLCDWGLAEIIDSQCENPHLIKYSDDLTERRALSLSGRVQGTPGYMAPEQRELGGKKDQRTDIYALGAILYELITPNSVTQIKDLDIDSDFIADSADKSLSAITAKALAVNKEERYKSCDELLSELSIYRDGFATSAENADFSRQLLLFYKRNMNVINAALTIILIVTATFIVSFISISKSEQAAVMAKEKLELEKAERLRLGREAAPRYLSEARTNLSNGELDESLKQAQAAVVLDPENDEARNLLATVYFLQENYQEAARTFGKTTSELYKELKKVNASLINANSSEKAKRKLICDFVSYCKAQSDEPLAFCIMLNLLNHSDSDVRYFTAVFMQLQPRDSLRVLKQISLSSDTRVRGRILKRVLQAVGSNRGWNHRRQPAELGAKLSTTETMKAQFQALIPDNLALGQPITSFGGEERAVEYAVDGDRGGEAWAATPFPAHCTVDLGAVYSVSQFLVSFKYESPRYYHYTIEVSENGTIFKTVVEKTDNRLNLRTPFRHVIPPTSARYVRLRITYNSFSTVVHVQELEVYK